MRTVYFQKRLLNLKKIDYKELNAILTSESSKTKIYFGSDSRVFFSKTKAYVIFSVVVVVHLNGCNGGKIFVRQFLDEYKEKNLMKRPYQRLMKEVEYLANEFQEVMRECEEGLLDKEIEVHLDFSHDPKNFSSLVVQSAVGYIRGTCFLEPFVKPDSFAASHVADAACRKYL
jgi:predicted RNase H-related nuclease YkuK (DUF458 family)